jgi:hypothetical protein
VSMQYAGFVVVVVLHSVIALECGIRHGINVEKCIRDCNVYPGLGDLCIVKYCPSMDVLWDGIVMCYCKCRGCRNAETNGQHKVGCEKGMIETFHSYRLHLLRSNVIIVLPWCS